MFRIEEMFESAVLDEFYEARSKGLFSIILKKNNFDNSAIEQNLLDSIKQFVKNNDNQKQILENLTDFEESMDKETTILTKNLYKMGFVDGILFAKDVKEILRLLKSKK